jgi:hypothetical protein
MLAIHTWLPQGLFKPELAKIAEAENIIQNSFSWAGSFDFYKFFPAWLLLEEI